MAGVIIIDPDINIWDEFKFLETISEFKTLKIEEGEERSSNILKAVYFIWDPKSELRDSSFDEKKVINDINSSLLEPDFNWDNYDHIREAWMKFCTSKAETLLLRYEDEINGLNTLLEKWIWSKEDAKAKAELVKTYRTLFDDFIEVKNEFEAEKQELIEFLGGYELSMIEEYGEA